jgi:hypothetical protein
MSSRMANMARPGWYNVRLKPSGKWEARWAEETGKICAQTFLTEGQARHYAMKQAVGIVDVKAGLRISSKKFEEAVEAFCQRADKKEKTHDINRRCLERFQSLNNLAYIRQIDEGVINRTFNWLKEKGHNSGGQNHDLKIINAFCHFCSRNKWMNEDPFPPDFRMPKPKPSCKALTEEQFEKLTSIRPEYVERDTWMRNALILGRYLIARTSTVFNLTPESFRNDCSEVFIPEIKLQDARWTPVHPKILPMVKDLVHRTSPGERLLKFWTNQNQLQDHVAHKASWVGLPGISFHDACKATQITQMSRAGMIPADIAEVTNTSLQTILKYYIVPDRQRALRNYHQFDPGNIIELPQTRKQAIGEDQTRPRPENGGPMELLGVNEGPIETTSIDGNAFSNEAKQDISSDDRNK